HVQFLRVEPGAAGAANFAVRSATAASEAVFKNSRRSISEREYHERTQLAVVVIGRIRTQFWLIRPSPTRQSATPIRFRALRCSRKSSNPRPTSNSALAVFPNVDRRLSRHPVR